VTDVENCVHLNQMLFLKSNQKFRVINLAANFVYAWALYKARIIAI